MKPRITALGMSSPLGGAVQACAAFRAGLSRVEPSRDLVCRARGESEPQPLPVLEASGVTFGLRGVGRLVALLGEAFQDMAPAADLPRLAALPLFLAVPDPMARDMPVEQELWRDTPGKASALGERVLEQVFENLGLRRGRQPWHFFGGGHAAFSSAVAAAHQGLRRRDFPACLVAAVDSLVIPEVLEAMLAEGWLKTPDNPVGFIPGEAAVVACLSGSRSDGDAEPLALLPGVALGHEPRAEDGDAPPLGQTLTQCLLTALQDAEVPTGRLLLVSDHDGEQRRAMELGGLRVSLRGQGVGDEGLSVWLPSMGFGNTGAASGAVGLCVAVRGLHRRHAPAPLVAVLSVADGPERAALIVSTPSAPRT